MSRDNDLLLKLQADVLDGRPSPKEDRLIDVAMTAIQMYQQERRRSMTLYLRCLQLARLADSPDACLIARHVQEQWQGTLEPS